MVKQTQSKKVTKSEKNEPIVVESPIKASGMSDTTRGIIIGVLVTALIATLVILLILGQNNNKDNNYNSNSGNNVQGDLDPSTYSEGLNEFYEYFNSKDKTLIVFASSQCGYCVAQKPIVEALAKEYKFDYLYMDYLELSSDAEISLVIDELGIEGSTPASVVVQDGKVLNTWVGYVDGKGYLDNLVNSGLIDKNATYDLESEFVSIKYDKFLSLLKDSETSAVIVDMPTCAVCYEERIALNELAKEYDLKLYQMSAQSLSDEEIEEFSDKLGDWGYDNEEYEETGQVEVPLLLFVKDGKIKTYKVGYTEDDDLEALFEKAGLIK